MTGELAHEALEAIDIAGRRGSFQIADLGAADGGASIDFVRRIIGGGRGRLHSGFSSGVDVKARCFCWGISFYCSGIWGLLVWVAHN